MLFVGNQRGGGKNLALHLMKEENERVEIHDLRGFASDTLAGAFKESYAISRATKCKQHLFSLSINPSPRETASTKDFEDAIARAEETLGLSGQPRAIVFHEKAGDDGKIRRHAHAVWCRINTEEMKAIQLSFTKRKLMELSRDLYIEHDWKMPRGMMDVHSKDPRNFSLAEWQQAKRAGKDPKEVKGIFKDAWAVSDSRAGFANALAERGYILSKGKRGHVAVDFKGEVYPVSRWVEIKAKQVRAKLGGHADLPNVEQAQATAAGQVAYRLKELHAKQARKERVEKLKLAAQREDLRTQQQLERQNLVKEQMARKAAEAAEREARLRKGLFGLLDRVTGKRKQTLEQNQQEANAAKVRDRQERAQISQAQQERLNTLRQTAETAKARHTAIKTELRQDYQWLMPPDPPTPEQRLEAFKTRRRNQEQSRTRSRDGPSMEM